MAWGGRRLLATQMGIWREDSCLDHADRLLSRPIFNLSLPAPLELLLAVPSVYLGLPYAFVGSTPLAVAWLASGGGNTWAGLSAALVLAFGAVVVLAGLCRWIDIFGSTKVATFCMPLVTCAILDSSFVPEAARAAALTSMSSSALCLVAIVPIQALVARPRPVVALKLLESISWPRTELMRPYIEALASPGQVFGSFPSADIAVVASSAVVLGHSWAPPEATWAPITVAVACVVLSCIGRMYFWAHHLLDIAFGVLFGALAAELLVRFDLGCHFFDLAAVYALFIVTATLTFLGSRGFKRARQQLEESQTPAASSV